MVKKKKNAVLYKNLIESAVHISNTWKYRGLNEIFEKFGK